MKFSEQHIISFVKFSGGAFLAVVVCLLFLSETFTTPELAAYDWRFQIRGDRPPLEDILIVPIDEESERLLDEKEADRRQLHADLVTTLTRHHPKLIVYDLYFDSETTPDADKAFANALYNAYDEERQTPLVILPVRFDNHLIRPLEMFADNVGRGGVINIEKDRDNIIRSLPVLFVSGDEYYFTLSLVAAAQYKGGFDDIAFPERDMLVLQEASKKEVLRVAIPGNQFYINYIGGRFSYPMLTFAEILRGEFQPEMLAGKVIFIGPASQTAKDFYLTPFQQPAQRYIRANNLQDARFSKTETFGVEIHAQAFQTILESSEISPLSLFWTIVLILVSGILSGILFFQDRKFLLNSVFLLALSGVLWGISYYLFTIRYLWITVTPLQVMLVVNYVAGIGFQRAVSLHKRNQIKRAFEYYVSSSVAEEMLQHPEKLHLGGEQKFLTILFADIRSFTTLSEGMTPTELVALLNEYLTAMTDIVMKYDGTLDKYIGDAIMAFYGAPLDQADHAKRACATALEMLVKLQELQQHWQAQNKPLINIGIGVNSGQMTVGNMGSEKRFDYTVMGDAVNLGSRLEGLTKHYGVQIILSEFTYQVINTDFLVRELDCVRVKGKNKPVTIYELVGQADQFDGNPPEWIELFHQGRAAYKQQHWESALDYFQQVLRLRPHDQPAQCYCTRCQEYQHNPPHEDWDGVCEMTTK